MRLADMDLQQKKLIIYTISSEEKKLSLSAVIMQKMARIV